MYSIVDDCGVWIVAKRANGTYASQDVAQFHADCRNYTHGVADECGVLYTISNEERDRLFLELHLKHADCTCVQIQGRAEVDLTINPHRSSLPIEQVTRGRRNCRHATLRD